MLQDHAKAMELLTKSAELGYSKAHSSLGNIYYEGGNMKKAKFHLEAGAMAGMKWQGTILESWSVILEKLNKP